MVFQDSRRSSVWWMMFWLAISAVNSLYHTFLSLKTIVVPMLHKNNSPKLLNF